MPTLGAAYREWGRLLAAMRAITLSAFLILLAISVAAEFVPQRLWEQELAGEALGLVQDGIWAFLLAPFVIAVHRFVILGKITPAFTLPVGAPLFRVFFGWLFALKVLLGLPFSLLAAAQALDWSLRATTLVLAAALIAAVAVLLRLVILLPALAMLSLIMGGVLQTITLSLAAVIASCAFMALAAQVERAAAPHAAA